MTEKRRKKLSETIADALLDRITEDDMQPGDRLPKEHELIEQFGCSKSTLREALKSLENQGILTIGTGPNGGARLVDVTYTYANQSLRNYFRFKSISPGEIYEVRRPLEIELCRSVIGKLSDETLASMKEVLDRCESFLDHPETNFEIWRMRRRTEIEFNSIIAAASPNPLLGFLCQFINDLICDTIVDKYLYFDTHIKEEYGRNLFQNLSRYFKCLKDADEAGAVECVHERMTFISTIVIKVAEDAEKSKKK